MRLFRTSLVALSAAAVGGALAFSVAAAPGAAPAARHGHAHLTASFLAEAHAAFIQDFRRPDTALWVHGAAAAPNAAGNIAKVKSYNWAGYADVSSTSGKFTKVSGSWKVPKLTCTSEDRITAQWVGLDGATTTTVEQDGTAEQCFEGKALYTTWYEMYPAGSVTVGSTVAAGDSISASVTRSGASYTLKLTDSTHTANGFTKKASCATTTCLDESAEWITERPAYSSTGIVPEAQFPTATFSGASETASGKTASISGYSGTVDDITCLDSTGTYDIVTTSGLTSTGAGFTNTWKNSF
jgi:Peptidase A4 family